MGLKSASMSFDDYIMGRTSEEYQRLHGQAQIWEVDTKRVLQQVSLKGGMTCLDVGCGPGDVIRQIGEIVGPSGHVTGLDTDGKLGREALNMMQATTKSQFAFIEGDVEELDDISGQPFDLTFARILLIHLWDPIAVLQKMYDWTKPGGHIVVQEYDFRTWEQIRVAS